MSSAFIFTDHARNSQMHNLDLRDASPSKFITPIKVTNSNQSQRIQQTFDQQILNQPSDESDNEAKNFRSPIFQFHPISGDHTSKSFLFIF